jgi:hypothetical protein
MFWCKLAELFFKTHPRKSVRKNILARCVEHLSSGASVHGQLSARCFNRYSTHVFRLRNYAASAALDTLCQRLSPLYKELGWVSLAGLELSHFNPLLTNLSPRRIRFDGWQKFTSGISFQEVPLRSIAQSCAYYLGVRVLS